jgi:hypothetical protein
MAPFYRLSVLLLFFISYQPSSAQNCFSTGINGTVINLPCGVSCTPLNFKVPHLKSTSDYNLVSIPYAPILPFASPSGTELTSLYIDDVYAPLVNLPFAY